MLRQVSSSSRLFRNFSSLERTSQRTSILLLLAMWKIVPNSYLSQCRESLASFNFKHRSQSLAVFLPFHHCAHIIFWLSLNWVHYSCNQPTHVLASTRKNWENRFLSMRRMKKFKKFHSVIVAHWLGTFFHTVMSEVSEAAQWIWNFAISRERRDIQN